MADTGSDTVNHYKGKGDTDAQVPSSSPASSLASYSKRARRSGGGPLFRAPYSAGKKRIGARGWLIAGAAHVLVGAVLLRTITFGHGIDGFFSFGEKTPTEERVTWVEPSEPRLEPKSAAELPKPQPQPLPAEAVKPPIDAATTNQGPPPTPVVVVNPPSSAGGQAGAAADTGSGGGLAGSTVGAVKAELRGVQPAFADPRLWGTAVPGAPERRTGTDRLDSIISYAIVTAADSLEAIARRNGETGRRPGDWTTRDKDGNKWGWDEGGIRLGKVTIPNALLGLLPMNAQMAMAGNPNAIDRERRLALARQDIMANSRRSVGEAEFRKLVRELRDRKEREYQERQKAKERERAAGNND